MAQSDVLARGGAASLPRQGDTRRVVRDRGMSHFILASIVIFALLGGCSSKTWVKPGATQQDFAVADYQCERDARMVEAPKLYNKCMAALGWSKQDVPQ